MELFRLARIVVRYRFVTAGVFSASVVVALSLCLFLPRRYASSFTVLSPDGGRRSILNALDEASYNSGIRGWVIPQVLSGEDFVVDAFTRRFTIWEKGRPRETSLSDVAGTTERRALLARAGRYLRVSLDEANGSIRVTAETPNPELSWQAAEYVLDRLERFVEDTRRDLQEASRAYYLSRIEEARSGLLLADAELGGYLERNRDWIGTDDPGARMELESMRRKQEIHAEVYFELCKRREMDDLRTLALVPPLEVLDRPQLPTTKSFPRRVVVLAAGLLAGMLLAVGAAIACDLYRRAARSTVSP